MLHINVLSWLLFSFVFAIPALVERHARRSGDRRFYRAIMPLFIVLFALWLGVGVWEGLHGNGDLPGCRTNSVTGDEVGDDC